MALGLRIALSLAYQPATLSQFGAANVYVWQAQGSLFASALQAPGYSGVPYAWRHLFEATRSR